MASTAGLCPGHRETLATCDWSPGDRNRREERALSTSRDHLTVTESQPVEGDVTKYRDRVAHVSPDCGSDERRRFQDRWGDFSTRAGPAAAGHCVMGQAVGRAAEIIGMTRYAARMVGMGSGFGFPDQSLG
jgi:hypothetical protein